MGTDQAHFYADLFQRGEIRHAGILPWASLLYFWLHFRHPRVNASIIICQPNLFRRYLAAMAVNYSDPGLRNFVDDRDRLIAIACRIVDNQAVAEELVQESWLRWNRSSYPGEKARPIFRRIVANLARDWRRRRSTETLIVESLPDATDHLSNPERILIGRQELGQLVEALNELEPKVVTAFRLHRVEGLTMTQIADRLETVPSRIHAYIVKALAHITLRLME